MIITQEEIDQLQNLLQPPDGKSQVMFEPERYVRRNPHLFLAAGFDEVRIPPSPRVLPTLAENPKFYHDMAKNGSATCFGTSPEDIASTFNRIEESRELRHITCRLSASGLWYEGYDPDEKTGRLTYYPNRIFLAPLRSGMRRWTEAVDKSQVISFTLYDLVNQCRKLLSTPTAFGALVLPNVWMPPESHPELGIVSTTKDILNALQKGKVTLDDITWRNLEEIVAELLKARGMQVTVTPRARDGGRDVIARGELIPGEPTILAVEVKHRKVVSVDEVRSRLYANKEFPAIMFATSGRYSAGVIKEKLKPENYLRLLLKDGKALSQWIADYSTAPTTSNH